MFAFLDAVETGAILCKVTPKRGRAFFLVLMETRVTNHQFHEHRRPCGIWRVQVLDPGTDIIMEGGSVVDSAVSSKRSCIIL